MCNLETLLNKWVRKPSLWLTFSVVHVMETTEYFYFNYVNDITRYWKNINRFKNGVIWSLQHKSIQFISHWKYQQIFSRLNLFIIFFNPLYDMNVCMYECTHELRVVYIKYNNTYPKWFMARENCQQKCCKIRHRLKKKCLRMEFPAM